MYFELIYLIMVTKAQWRKGRRAQRHRGTEAQRHKGTRAQRSNKTIS